MRHLAGEIPSMRNCQMGNLALRMTMLWVETSWTRGHHGCGYFVTPKRVVPVHTPWSTPSYAGWVRSPFVGRHRRNTAVAGKKSFELQIGSEGKELCEISTETTRAIGPNPLFKNGMFKRRALT